MKPVVIGAVVLSLMSMSRPAAAQLGGIMNKAQQANNVKKSVDSLTISDDEERKIGTDVSAKLRARFGVVQDAAVTKYVTLVGMTMAQQTERPNLQWTFIVLDTDGVNAFASPGGFVHITRGALGLIKNEGELAGVLGHEIGHVVHKHTVNSIRKANAEKMASQAALADRGPFLNMFTDFAYGQILEGKFDRNDELDADKFGVDIAAKVGYAPASLADFLQRLDDRNKDQPERNGLFASHPDTKERIQKIKTQAGSKTGAIVLARYTSNIKYTAPPLASIAVVADGASGLTGSTAPAKDAKKTDDDKKKEEPKKGGLGLTGTAKTTSSDNQSAQVSASGGARGVGADRAAKGGPNPALVKVAVSASELADFKKGIA
jgi:beta-barrel assembly-enhancing protease